MLFSRSFLVALVSAPFLASAELAFTLNSTFAPTAGESSVITWSGSTSGTVTLVLRSGASSNLNTGTIIGSSIPDTGSYTWTPDANTVRGSDYALQIINNQDTSDNNYSAYFVLESDNTTPSQASTVPNPASTAMPSSTLSGASSASSGSSSMSGSMTRSASASASSGTRSSQTGSSTQGDLQAASQTSSMPGAGARATAAVGVLGAVALAAMAL